MDTLSGTNWSDVVRGTGGQAMKKYLVVIEKAGDNFSAYVPDLPGCVTTGKSIEDAEAGIREAMSLYLDTLREDGKPVPEPTTKAKPVSIAA
jgi:predicted RNase H-like HicB family nuclease